MRINPFVTLSWVSHNGVLEWGDVKLLANKWGAGIEQPQLFKNYFRVIHCMQGLLYVWDLSSLPKDLLPCYARSSGQHNLRVVPRHGVTSSSCSRRLCWQLNSKTPSCGECSYDIPTNLFCNQTWSVSPLLLNLVSSAPCLCIQFVQKVPCLSRFVMVNWLNTWGLHEALASKGCKNQ